MRNNFLLTNFLCLLSLNIVAQTFSPVFNSGGTIKNSKSMIVGDFDGDDYKDIAITSNTPNSRLAVFESTEDNEYDEVFTINAPVMKSIAYGDTDNDDYSEIIGFPVGSSVFQIVMFENTGDNQFVERSIDISEEGCTQCQSSKVMVADLDMDEKMEIIFSYESPSGAIGSKLFIYEHDTIAGINHYSKVYEFATAIDASIDGFTIGDSDNDGQKEILLDIYNGTIVRLENNGDNSFVLKSANFNTSMSMRDLHVSDVDMDGDNELMLVGKPTGNSSGRIIIFESPTDDQYVEDFVLDGIGTLINRVNAFSDGEFSFILLGRFDGIVDILEYQNQNYSSVLTCLLYTSPSPRDRG